MAEVWKVGDPKIPHDAALVDRSTKWGNPFQIGKDGGRNDVIERYALYLNYHPELISALPELRGKDLVCHCAPKRCHAEVLMRLANEEL